MNTSYIPVLTASCIFRVRIFDIQLQIFLFYLQISQFYYFFCKFCYFFGMFTIFWPFSVYKNKFKIAKMFFCEIFKVEICANFLCLNNFCSLLIFYCIFNYFCNRKTSFVKYVPFKKRLSAKQCSIEFLFVTRLYDYFNPYLN